MNFLSLNFEIQSMNAILLAKLSQRNSLLSLKLKYDYGYTSLRIF